MGSTRPPDSAPSYGTAYNIPIFCRMLECRTHIQTQTDNSIPLVFFLVQKALENQSRRRGVVHFIFPLNSFRLHTGHEFRFEMHGQRSEEHTSELQSQS